MHNSNKNKRNLNSLLLLCAVFFYGCSGSTSDTEQPNTTPPPDTTTPPDTTIPPDTNTPPSGSDLVSLTVTEPAGQQQSQANVRSGIPFAKGALLADDTVALFDAEQMLPGQFKALSRWDDGSIRWLLADTLLPLSASETRTLNLKKLSDAATPVNDGIVIAQTDTMISVDTGPLKVEIPTQYGGIIHRAWINNQMVIEAPAAGATDRGAYISVFDSQNNSTDDFFSSLLTSNWVPSPTDLMKQYTDKVANSGDSTFNLYNPWRLQVEVEEAGDVHAVIRISGAHLNASAMSFSSFVVRLHFYKNDPAIKVAHSMVYNGDETKQVNRYGLKLPMPVSASSTLIEGVTPIDGLGEVRHLTHSQHEINGSQRNGAALGYIGRSRNNVNMSIALRDMAEKFPKALLATETGLDVQLYADSATPWDLSRYKPDPEDSDFSTFPGVEIASRIGGETTRFPNHFFLRGAQGLGTSDDYVITFATGDLNATVVAQQAAVLDAGPLRLVAPPSWYSDAKVMGIGAFAFAHDVNNAEGHYRIDKALQVTRDFMRVAQRQQFNWYGIENYGDIRGRFFGSRNGSHTFYKKGRYGWSGNSGEPSNQLWIQYLRKPDQQTWLDAEALARHTLDQQTVHFASSEAQAGTELDGRNMFRSVGSLHRHGVQAWSGYAGSPDYSHVAGVETYYYLTGDQRAKEVLYEHAQFIVRQSAPKTSLKNGLDVVARAAAVFNGQTTIQTEFNNKIAVFMDYLQSEPNNNGYNAVQARLIDRANSNGVHDRTEGVKTNRALYQDGFEYFIRGAPGLLYYHEYTGNAAAANLILDAADILTQGDPKSPSANGDDWQLMTDGHAGSLFYHINSISYAAELARTLNVRDRGYYELAKRCIENNTHAGTDTNDTSPISLTTLMALPDDWTRWRWTWQEDAAFDATNPGILWLDRVLMYQNDYVQDYHSYRALHHLATGAALVPQGEMQLR